MSSHSQLIWPFATVYDCFVGLLPEHLSSAEAFLLSNQKTLFLPHDKVIFRGVACLVSSFPEECVILNLSQCDIIYLTQRSARATRTD